MSRAGTGRPTLTQVAEEAGVSIATASYVVNDADKPISEATRTRVLAAAAALGYVPNAAAATLRRGRSNLALVVVDATYVGAVSARTIDHVTQGIRAAGFTTLVHTMTDEAELLGVVAATQPHGIGLLTFVSETTRRRLGDLGVRLIVGYESPADGAEGDRSWERAIGAAQAAHLVERGHRALLYVVPPETEPRHPVARARLQGAVEECRRRRVRRPRSLATPPDRGLLAVELVAAREAGVTGVCTHDDEMGLAVLAAMADLGWSAPEDLAVVGADDDVTSSLSQPPLSTVRIPDAGYGALAERVIALAAQGEPTPPSLIDPPPPSLVQRASS